MEQYTKTPLHLQNFTVTKTYNKKERGIRTFFICGHLNEETRKKLCPYLPARSIERLEEVLSANEKLQTTYYLGEMLKASLHCTNQQIYDSSFKKWLFMAKKTGYEELLKFCDLVKKHWEGIRNRVMYNISNGPIEGTNCLIKNIRRQSYGIRDDEYFFLKIWEATRRNIKNRQVV